MAHVYRRCDQCDYYARDSKERAQRSLDQHQQATGHVGQSRVLGDPIVPPDDHTLRDAP